MNIVKILKQIHPHIWKYTLTDPYKRECVCCHAAERWWNSGTEFWKRYGLVSKKETQRGWWE